MAKTLIKMTRYKMGLTLSCNGGALPEPLENHLSNIMTYTHVRFLHGAEAYDQDTGDRVPISAEERRLYRISENHGRYTCGAGYLDRLKELLPKLGYDTEISDSTPVYRPEAFNVDYDNVAARYEFKDRQDEMLAVLIDNPQGGVFKAPPGFGKSYFFCAVALAFPKARICVIIPGIPNVRKSARHLQSYLPSVGVVGDGELDTSKRITVCSANSMHHLDETQIDILLVDEAHKLMADEYSAGLVHVAGCARRYAFTATPEGRKDGTDVRMESVFGQWLFDMTNQEGVAAGLILPVEVHWRNVINPYNPCINSDGTKMYDVERKRWGIWRHRLRNEVIAKTCREVQAAGRQVLVLLDVLEHALYLQEFLPDFPVVYSSLDKKQFTKFVKQGILDPDHQVLKNTDRDSMYQDFRSQKLKCAIATSVWSTGVSFESLQDVVRADARGGSQIYDEQLAGRTQRLDPATEKTVGRVYDFLDQFDEGFHRAAQTRRTSYKRVGYQQVLPPVNPRQLQLRM